MATTTEQKQVERGELHRVELEFEPGYGATLKLIHPEGGCEAATACSECWRRTTDPATPPCEFCPSATDDECWLTGWVDNLTADEMLAGPIEFAVSPECDGETLTLHVAAESAPTQQDKAEEKIGTEYRILSERHDGRRISGCPTLEIAKSYAKELAAGTDLIPPHHDVRIQKRTVVTTPWEDVADE